MNHLQTGLKKVAQAAKQLHATVHLPRIGAHLPTTNYYSIERMIRNSLASKGIETYIYYFPRGGGSGKKPAAVGRSSSFSRSQSMSASPVSAKVSQSPSIVDDEDGGDAMDVVKPHRQPSSVGPDASSAPESSVLPFHGLRINIYNAGAQFMKLKNAILALGGIVDLVISKNTTHVVTNSSEIDQILSINIASHPSLPVVSARWVHECAEQQTLLPLGAFQLHRQADDE
jgi:hypothetical protein